MNASRRQKGYISLFLLCISVSLLLVIFLMRWNPTHLFYIYCKSSTPNKNSGSSYIFCSSEDVVSPAAHGLISRNSPKKLNFKKMTGIGLKEEISLKNAPENPRERIEPHLKVILYWTDFHRMEYWWNLTLFGQGPLTYEKCKYRDCYLSGDKRLNETADMLLFNYDSEPNWPGTRSPHQYYVHFMDEPPSMLHSFLTEYENMINLTINYRHDADVYAPYDWFVKTNNLSPSPYVPRVPFEMKTLSVVWMVSNCAAKSDRYAYTKELSKYIDVDIYGKCGNLTCAKDNNDSCFRRFEKKYKFYLGFESNICVDYITEKFFTPLRYELVPIVMGHNNYTEKAPPHSVIDIRDYSSPKELAAYLHTLSKDEQKYNEYFQWKPYYENYKKHHGHMFVLCDLCRILHKGHPRKGKPAHSDYWAWWFGSCDNHLVTRMREKGGW